jgi:small-conductance mechanosensitive channel
MKRQIVSVCIVIITCLLQSAVPAAAQDQSPATSASNESSGDQNNPEEETAAPGQVVIDGQPVLRVYEPVGTLTLEGRAKGIAARVIALAGDSSISPESIRLQPRDSWTEIIAENTMILAVTDADAKAAGKKRQQLAVEDAESIRQVIRTYRQEHSWRVIVRAILKTAVATLILVVLLWLVRRFRLSVRARIQRRIVITADREKKLAWYTSFVYLGPMILAVGTFLRWVLILSLLETYLTVTLGFYSSTREISLTANRWVLSQLELLARSGLDYMPNLLVLAVIALLSYYALRLIKLIFGRIRKGDLTIPGFYPDWAEPTDKLLRLLFLVLVLIAAFPYLPGARSPAFRGISIFVGLLLSLGSSSAIANAIAGVILTYMRSFLIGDWIQIGDTMGEVVEQNLLVTRILTPKAEIITIPNSAVMSGSVKNYSTQAKKGGVVFHTTVSIGFDAPWRTVHQLLISAALATEHVLRQPAPFVLQQSLDDFYVTYELNAFTDTPSEVLNIFSDLHRNIQDKFNEGGVEICSPHFSALRDANRIAIPGQYIKPGYRAPSFGLNLNESENNNAPQTTRVAKPLADQ